MFPEEMIAPPITNDQCRDKKIQLDQNIHDGSVLYDGAYSRECFGSYTKQTIGTGAIIATILVLIVVGAVVVSRVVCKRRKNKV